jgi:hypothetical protein
LTVPQITLSQDALKSITAKIVELSEVVGSVFDELIDHVEIPRTFTMYTVRYCTEKQTGEGPPTLQCFPFGPSRFDIVAGAPYAICIVSSLVGLSLLFPFLNNRYQNTKRWYWIMSCHWVAFLAISFASVLPTVLAYTSHAMFAESLPLEIFSLEVGGKFLALTWSAWMSSSLALMIVQRIRHIHLQS